MEHICAHRFRGEEEGWGKFKIRVTAFSWTMREPLETRTTVTTKHSRMLWKGVGSSSLEGRLPYRRVGA